MLYEYFLSVLLFSVMGMAALFDYRTKMIPKPLIYGGFIMTTLYLVFWITPALSHHLITLGVFFVIFKILFDKGILGGDVKLLMLVSYVLPFWELPLAFGCLFIIGGIFSLFWKFIFKEKTLPYAVPLFFGYVVYLML